MVKKCDTNFKHSRKTQSSWNTRYISILRSTRDFWKLWVLLSTTKRILSHRILKKLREIGWRRLKSIKSLSKNSRNLCSITILSSNRRFLQMVVTIALQYLRKTFATTKLTRDTLSCSLRYRKAT